MNHNAGFYSGKVLNNISWLMADRIYRLLLGLLITIWVARHLGPQDFGTLSYAMAIAAIFIPLATLGLETIVVRDLVKKPESAGTTLGATLLLHCVATVGTIALLALSNHLIDNDTTTKLVVLLVSLTLSTVLSSFVQYWYQSQILSKHVVKAQLVILTLSNGARAMLILVDAGILYFAAVLAIESITITIVNVLIYWRGATPHLRFSAVRTKRLLVDSWPLLLSGVAVTVYMKIDQVMLKHFSGAAEVGIYTSATTISEAWYFVPAAIVASAYPKIAERFSNNRPAYDRMMYKLIRDLWILAVIIAICLSASASIIISILFGEDFESAAPVLLIHAWGALFVAIGVASSRWYADNELQTLQMLKTIAGAVVNVLLNLYMIPRFGAIGAAVSTVISFSISAYFSDLAFLQTRQMFKIKTRAMFLRGDSH